MGSEVGKLKLSHAQRLLNLIARNTIWRAIHEVHVEAAVNHSVFKKLLSFSQQHPQCFVMLTTPEEPWIKLRIQAEYLSRQEYGQILEDRYSRLFKVHSLLGLHVHLFHPKSVRIPDFRTQLEKIRTAKAWLEDLGLPSDHFASGWFGYNRDTIGACEQLGIKYFHVPSLRNGCEQSDSLKFLTMRNILHDWEL